MFILIIIISLFAVSYIILQHPVFGKSPSGERLERIKKSPQFNGKEFENLSVTPQLSNGASMPQLLWDMIVGNKPDNTVPKGIIPSINTDLKNLQEETLVWFGHSSYLFKLEGKTFLVDPVFSGNASPIPNSVKAFKGANTYGVVDMPEIDFLIISHDHYDHLDYKTMKEIIPKVKQVVCGLGVGSHLEHWGFAANIIHELDWYESYELENSLTLTATPARHFSGRSLKRNTTLWCSYVLDSPGFKMFIGGDSGFDTHFEKIGNTYGPFDLAILENGQYSKNWANIHTLPEELMAVKHDLKAKAALLVHSGKFELAPNPWDESYRLAVENAQKENDRLLIPKIGEIVRLKDSSQVFENWWEKVD